MKFKTINIKDVGRSKKNKQSSRQKQYPSSKRTLNPVPIKVSVTKLIGSTPKKKTTDKYIKINKKDSISDKISNKSKLSKSEL